MTNATRSPRADGAPEADAVCIRQPLMAPASLVEDIRKAIEEATLVKGVVEHTAERMRRIIEGLDEMWLNLGERLDTEDYDAEALGWSQLYSLWAEVSSMAQASLGHLPQETEVPWIREVQHYRDDLVLLDPDSNPHERERIVRNRELRARWEAKDEG